MAVTRATRDVILKKPLSSGDENVTVLKTGEFEWLVNLQLHKSSFSCFCQWHKINKLLLEFVNNVKKLFYFSTPASRNSLMILMLISRVLLSQHYQKRMTIMEKRWWSVVVLPSLILILMACQARLAYIMASIACVKINDWLIFL